MLQSDARYPLDCICYSTLHIILSFHESSCSYLLFSNGRPYLCTSCTPPIMKLCTLVHITHLPPQAWDIVLSEVFGTIVPLGIQRQVCVGDHILQSRMFAVKMMFQQCSTAQNMYMLQLQHRSSAGTRRMFAPPAASRKCNNTKASEPAVRLQLSHPHEC